MCDSGRLVSPGQLLNILQIARVRVRARLCVKLGNQVCETALILRTRNGWITMAELANRIENAVLNHK